MAFLIMLPHLTREFAEAFLDEMFEGIGGA